jgi:hypothetical protein
MTPTGPPQCCVNRRVSPFCDLRFLHALRNLVFIQQWVSHKKKERKECNIAYLTLEVSDSEHTKFKRMSRKNPKTKKQTKTLPAKGTPGRAAGGTCFLRRRLPAGVVLFCLMLKGKQTRHERSQQFLYFCTLNDFEHKKKGAQRIAW